jgi:hypothetical protein
VFKRKFRDNLSLRFGPGEEAEGPCRGPGPGALARGIKIMKYCCVLVDFFGALPGEFLPTEWQSPSGGIRRLSMGPGPGGHGRAAVDEPRVTANWNEYASLVQLLSPRLTRIGFRRLGIA